MAIFPTDDPAYSASDRAKMRPLIDGYSPDQLEQIKQTESEIGHSQFRDVWNRTRFAATLTIRARNRLIGILWNFWLAHRNRQTFTFFDFSDDLHVGVALGVATGGAQTLTVPAKEIHDLTVYKAGVVIASGATLSAGTGTEGRDRITLSSGAATAGQVITATFTGRRAYSCEFKDRTQKAPAGVDQQQIVMTIREAFN